MSKLKQLQKQWNLRLAKEGLAPLDNVPTLAGIDSHHRSAEAVSMRQEHYSRLEEVLWTYGFRSARDWLVWSLRCRGLYYSEIAAKIGVSKPMVFYIFERIYKELGWR